MSSVNKPRSLVDALQAIDILARKGPIKLQDVFNTLEGRGYPIMLIFLSLPFCLPVTIPGTSTPFGFILAFMGLRVAFGHQILWPKWLLDKQISSATALKITDKALEWAKKITFYLRPRASWLVSSPIFHRLHGLTVFFLALFMALPLPIPGTNMMAAIPIACIGVAMLEDDALFLTIGYAIAFLGVFYLSLLFLFGSKLLAM